MGLKEIYYGIEDKYYAFVEKLATMGLNLKPIIGAIESAGIPSLPLFAILFIAILGGAIFATGALSGVLGEGGTFVNGELTLKVQAKDGTPLDGATVELMSTDGEYSDSQDSLDGAVTFSDVPNKDLEVTVNAAGYKELKTKIKAGSNKVPKLSLEAKTGEAIKIKVTDEDSMPISGASVSYDPGSKITTTDISGTANLIVPIGSNVVVTISKNGFDPAVSQFTASYAGYTQQITLRKPNQRADSAELADLFGRGSSIPSPGEDPAEANIRFDDADINQNTTVTVTVGDGTNFTQGAKVTLFKDGTNDELANGLTNETGSVEFPGINQGIKVYTIVTKDGYVINTGFARTVTENLVLQVTLAKVIPNVNAINYTVFLEDAASPLASFNADVYLIEPTTNQFLLASPVKAAARNGRVTADFINVPIGQNAYVAVYAKTANYIRYASDAFLTTPDVRNATFQLTKATLETSGTIIARVVNYTEHPVDAANVSLFTTDGRFLPPLSTTSFDGTTQIDLAPNTTLYVNASIGIFEGNLRPGATANFTPLETVIKVVPKSGLVIFTAHEYGTPVDTALNGVEFNVFYIDAQGNRIKAHTEQCITGQTPIPNLGFNPNFNSANLPVNLRPAQAQTNQGKCALWLVSGVTYDVVATASGYVMSQSQLTVGMQALVNPTQTHAVSLFNANYPDLVQFQGIYTENDDENLTAVNKSLIVGEVYKAKFEILMPLTANKAALYLRAGNKPGITDDSVSILNDFNNYQEQATAFTTDYRVKASTSYLPNACGDYVYNDQFGLYKWFEFQVPRKALKAAAAYVTTRLEDGIRNKLIAENQNLALPENSVQLEQLVRQEADAKLENLNETDLLDLLDSAAGQNGVEGTKIALQINVPFIVMDRNNKNVTFEYRAYTQTGDVYTRFPEDERLGTNREVQGKKECEASTLNFSSRIDPSSTKVVTCNSNSCITLAFDQPGGLKTLKEPDLLTGDDTVYDVEPAVTNESTFPKQLNLTYVVRDFMPNFDDGRLLEFQPDAAYLPIDELTTKQTASQSAQPVEPGVLRAEFPQVSAALNKYINLIKTKKATESVIINPTIQPAPAVPVTLKYANLAALNTKVKLKGIQTPAAALAALPQGYTINYDSKQGTFQLVKDDGTSASKIDLTVDAILPADAIFLKMNFTSTDPQDFNVQLYDGTGCFELLQNPATEMNLPAEYQAYAKNLMLIKYDASTLENPRSPTGKCAAYSANPNRVGNALAVLNIKHLASPASIQVLLHAAPNTQVGTANFESIPQNEIPGSKDTAVKQALNALPAELAELKTGKGQIAEYKNEYAALIVQDKVWVEEGVIDFKLAESFMHALVNNRQYSRDGVISVMKQGCGADPLCQDSAKFVDRGDFWVKVPTQSTRVFTSQKRTLSDEVLAFNADELPLTTFERTYRLQTGVSANQAAQDGRTESPTARNDATNGSINLATKGEFITAVMPTRSFSVANGDGSEIAVLRGEKETATTGARVGGTALLAASATGLVLSPVGSVIAASAVAGTVGLSTLIAGGQSVGPQKKTIRLVENQAESMSGTEQTTVTLLHNTAFKRRSCDRGCTFARWPLTAFLPKETQPVSKIHLPGDLWTGTFDNGKVDFAFYGVNSPTQCQDADRNQEGVYDYYWAFSNLEDGTSSIQTANAEPLKLTANDYISTSCSTNEQQLCGKLSFGGGQCINNCGDGWYYGATVGTQGRLCDQKDKFKVTSFYTEGSRLRMLGKSVDDIANSIAKCYMTQVAAVATTCNVVTATGAGAVASTAAGIVTEEATGVLYDKLISENQFKAVQRIDLFGGAQTPQTFPSFISSWQKVCSYAKYGSYALSLYKAYAISAAPQCAPAFELAAERCLCLTGSGSAIAGCWLTKAFTSTLTNDASRDQIHSAYTSLTDYQTATKQGQTIAAQNQEKGVDRAAVQNLRQTKDLQQAYFNSIGDSDLTQKDGQLYYQGLPVKTMYAGANANEFTTKPSAPNSPAHYVIITGDKKVRELPVVLSSKVGTFYQKGQDVQNAQRAVVTSPLDTKLQEYQTAIESASTPKSTPLETDPQYKAAKDVADAKYAALSAEYAKQGLPKYTNARTVKIADENSQYNGATVEFDENGVITKVTESDGKVINPTAYTAPAVQTALDNYASATTALNSEESGAIARLQQNAIEQNTAQLQAFTNDKELTDLVSQYKPEVDADANVKLAKQQLDNAATPQAQLEAKAKLDLAEKQAALNAQKARQGATVEQAVSAEEEQTAKAKEVADAVCGGSAGDSSRVACENALKDEATRKKIETVETIQDVSNYICSYPFVLLGAQRLIGGTIYNPPERAHIAIIGKPKDGALEKIGGFLLDDEKNEVDCQQSDLLPTGPDADKDYVWNDFETSRLRLYADGKRRECMDAPNVQAVISQKSDLDASGRVLKKFYITSRG